VLGIPKRDRNKEKKKRKKRKKGNAKKEKEIDIRADNHTTKKNVLQIPDYMMCRLLSLKPS
jgi:hypothetical protein